MTRKRIRRIHVGLAIAMLCFLAGIAFRLSGCEFVSKVLMLAFLIVFFLVYFSALKFGIDINLRAWSRYKTKKEIFTDSLLDEDDENHPVK